MRVEAWLWLPNLVSIAAAAGAPANHRIGVRLRQHCARQACRCRGRRAGHAGRALELRPPSRDLQVKDMTLKTARAIFRSRYWTPLGPTHFRRASISVY